MFYSVMEKYNLRKIMKEDNVEVFCNDVICARITRHRFTYNIKIEYKDRFVKWTDVMYEKIFISNVLSDLDRLEEDIDRIISLRYKA